MSVISSSNKGGTSVDSSDWLRKKKQQILQASYNPKQYKQIENKSFGSDTVSNLLWMNCQSVCNSGPPGPPGPPDSWTEITTPGPSARNSHAMAFDSNTKKVVLFGGSSVIDGNFVAFDDTWEYNGTWRQVTIPGDKPSARANHAMAFDSNRNRVVLFGGFSLIDDNPVYFDDTWEYYNSTWHQVTITGDNPLGRTKGPIVFYPGINKIVLFGGVLGSQFFDDTWEYDGTWTQIQIPGPPVRAGSSMAFDSRINKIILFGGYSRTDPNTPLPDFLRDTWEYDGTWTQITTIGPSGRSASATVFDSNRNKIVLFGGSNTISLGDTWEF